MRAIFFSLLVIDACLLVWGMVFSGDSSANNQRQAASASYAGLPSLNLLNEVETLEPLDELPKSEASSQQRGQKGEAQKPGQITSAVKPDKPLCEMVGAFRAKSDADDFIERLTAIDVNSELKELELPAGPGYWVYLVPETTRKEAIKKLGELQAKGVDSYVIPKGELANGISLGMFSQKNLADLRLKEMQDIGLKPKMEVIERTYRELWVMLDKGEHTKMSQLTWDRIMENFESLERRQNFCLLDVASQDNFH